jgi:DNA-directed RNA polymerase specialized sigma24 family protein
MRGFLRSRTASRNSMEEVYSVFTEDVWKGLPQLRSDKHMRSWLYVVARNALSRHVRFKRRWRLRHTFSGLETLPAELRQSYGTREGNLAQLSPLLAELNEADRRLLDQRLVKSLAWRDIALESARAAGDTSEAFVTRESARLRKRYQLLLLTLRQRAPHETGA